MRTVDEQPAPATVPAADPRRRGDGGLDVGYEHLREAALHARAEAFPLGFGVLCRGGVTAWQRALGALNSPTTTAPATTPPAIAARKGPDHAPTPLPTPLPTAVAAELIHVLAAVALAEPTPEPTVTDPRRSHRCSPTPRRQRLAPRT